MQIPVKDLFRAWLSLNERATELLRNLRRHRVEHAQVVADQSEIGKLLTRCEAMVSPEKHKEATIATILEKALS